MDNSNRYSRGKIYRIIFDWSDKQYIGSTCQSLSSRKSFHKCDALQGKKGSFYNELRDHDFEGWTIELIEKYPCTSKEELQAREGYYMRKYRDENVPLFNLRLAHGNNPEYKEEQEKAKKEYRQKYWEVNKEVKNAERKERYKANRDTLLEKNREQFTCDVCSGKYTFGNRSNHKKTKKHQAAQLSSTLTEIPADVWLDISFYIYFQTWMSENFF